MFEVNEEHIPCILVRKTCPMIWGSTNDGVVHRGKLLLGDELYLDRDRS